MMIRNVAQKLMAWKRAALMIVAVVGLGLAGCSKSPTEPAIDQGSDSQAAADILAASIGTTSGGSGAMLDDAMILAGGGDIPGGIVPKGNGSAQSADTATVHTKTVSRRKSKDGFGYDGSWTYTWTFYDASGNAMQHFVKGLTDRIVITEVGQHSITTPRVTIADSSNGSWTITNIIAHPDAPTLNGTLTRAGSTQHMWNGRQMTHTFTINWTDDQLMRTKDSAGDDVTYLSGNANSDLKAVNFKGSSFERQVNINFHGDGTATLNVTRTSGDGKVDTFTVDVKRGIWLRDDHIG